MKDNLSEDKNSCLGLAIKSCNNILAEWMIEKGIANEASVNHGIDSDDVFASLMHEFDYR